jgi:L,D-peptidoglycan transpeptidase YkuD (ErfK/YbiS/YcfS/YnhG family)
MNTIFSFLTSLSFTLVCAALPATGFELPKNSTQCLLGVADDWSSSTVTLSYYEKSGHAWHAVGSAWHARLGKKGLVWGLGLNPVPHGATMKKEGDWRSPAGVFTLGGAWGYDAKIEKNPAQAYHQVTQRDLWVEDSTSPKYNQNVLLDHNPSTTWEKKQQMKQGDPAHALKLFIAHNTTPHAVPGAGSSIFFHIWRGGGSKPTAGCTTMPENKLRWVISNLNPAQHPLYVLLPKAEYEKYRTIWQLP